MQSEAHVTEKFTRFIPYTWRHRFVFMVNMLFNICKCRGFSNSHWPAAGLRVSPAAGEGGRRGGIGGPGARNQEVTWHLLPRCLGNAPPDAHRHQPRRAISSCFPHCFLAPHHTSVFTCLLFLLFPAKRKSFWWHRKEMQTC